MIGQCRQDRMRDWAVPAEIEAAEMGHHPTSPLSIVIATMIGTPIEPEIQG